MRDARFTQHVPPAGHPERPERMRAVDEALAPLGDALKPIAPCDAMDEDILRVHDRAHLETLRALAGRSASIDPDTSVSPRSYEIARLASGSLTDLARRVARGEAPSGFAAVRPPGHHAERHAAMGFCLFNSVAIAARALRANEGLERIAIVDWDVHHGNGTQHSFESERDVLYLSSHQFPFYPGTGALRETGRDAGRGATVNLPLPAGAGDAEYLAVYSRVAAPLLREFRPEMILVSAGFDAHAADPLASMRMSARGYARLTGLLRELADDLCGGRIVLALEGGYDLDALAASVSASLGALCERPSGTAPEGSLAPAWEEVVANLRAAHARQWPSLRPTARG
ncbi:MAG: histone deacetylase [Proteobacteria bacterium]|nr:histone deacetylase [Pseudomonadota bacterium]